MASRRDMKNLVARGGWFHFRGYVPQDLRRIGHAAEQTKSLNTTDYGEAIRQRNKARVEFDEWIGQERARRDGHYTVLTSLTTEQEIALALEVYRHLDPTIEEARQKLARRPVEEWPDALESEQALLNLTAESAVIGDDFFGAFKRYTSWVLEERMIRIDNAAAMERLQTRVGEAIVEIKQNQISRMRGVPPSVLDPRFVDLATLGPKPPSPALPGGSNVQSSSHKLDVHLRKFAESLTHSRGAKGRASVEYTNRLLVEVFGADMDVRNLRRKQIEEFRDLLRKVPSNSTKRYPGLPITTVVERRNPTHAVLSIESVNKNLGNVTQFVRWMHKLEIIHNPPNLDGIAIQNPVRENQRRPPFTTDQLCSIFGSAMMKEAARQQSVMFWCFVVGLYHGLRLNEIASLSPEDITVHSGMPTIEIRVPRALTEGERQGRTKVIPRRFPMHPILVKLGLPGLVVSRMGCRMLFHDAVRGTDAYYSDEVSDWTRQMLDSVGIPVGGPTFHSLRHNFRNATEALKMQDTMIEFLGGWSQSGVKNRVYLSDPGQIDVMQSLQRLTYGKIDEMILRLKPGNASLEGVREMQSSPWEAATND